MLYKHKVQKPCYILHLICFYYCGIKPKYKYIQDVRPQRKDLCCAIMSLVAKRGRLINRRSILFFIWSSFNSVAYITSSKVCKRNNNIARRFIECVGQKFFSMHFDFEDWRIVLLKNFVQLEHDTMLSWAPSSNLKIFFSSSVGLNKIAPKGPTEVYKV